jgi:hypothetical protein
LAEGEIEDKLRGMIENQHVQLVDADQNNLVEKHVHLAVAAQNDEDQSAISPSPRRLAGAELHMQESKFQNIQQDVIKFVRRKSLLREARELKVPGEF